MIARPETIPPGSVIAGRYRLERLLGVGGFGAVFAAADAQSGQRVALKILSAQALAESGGEARFRREAELARRLSHPNTVRVLDSGADPSGVLYITFELLEGRSVETTLRQEGPLSPKRACAIAIEVLSALEEAHSVGIVHRDIKPGNIFLIHERHDGAGGTLNAAAMDRVKVLDFGIAKSQNPNTRVGLTREGDAMGTPMYMAPEQILGQALGPFTDLYPLGLVLAEMVLGESVYGPNPSGMAVVAERVAGKPVPLPAGLSESPLGPLLKRATADVVYRFRTASEMKQALQGVLPSLSTLALETGSVRNAFVQAPTAVSMGRDPSERGSSASYASTPSASGALPTARGAGPSPLASSVLRSTPGAPSTVSWEPPTEGVPPDRSSQRRLAATAPDASRSSSNRLARTTNDYEVENSRASVAVSSKRLLERTVKSDEPLSSLAQQANRGPVTASRTKGRSALFVVLILMALLVVGGVCGALLYWRHHV